MKEARGDVKAVLDRLKRKATAATRASLSRYGIPAERALGVAMRDIQALARETGRDHARAAALWASGWYEARLLAAYVDDPAAVTPGQMDRWCRDFDNWAVCDTVCFALFDRTPHAWRKVEAWAARPAEYVKRAAFALIWGLSVHDKAARDEAFRRALALVEESASDERHFVKKAVSMALRAVGKRNAALRAAALELARRLAASSQAQERSLGKEALRDLERR